MVCLPDNPSFGFGEFPRKSVGFRLEVILRASNRNEGPDFSVSLVLQQNLGGTMYLLAKISRSRVPPCRTPPLFPSFIFNLHTLAHHMDACSHRQS